MENSFTLIKAMPVGISSTHKIIKASQYQTMLNGNSLLEAARKEAEAIVEASKMQACDAINKGYAQGLAQAKQECAEPLIKAKLQASHMLDEAEKDVINLVKLTIEKLFGEMDNEHKIASLVQSGLSSMRNDYQVKVRVAPEMEMIIKTTLADAVKDLPNMKYLDVVADSTLAADSCVLEGDASIVKTSVSDQLARLNSLVQSALLASK